MVGSDDLNACCMGAGDDFFDNVITGKNLDVDHVHKPCPGRPNVELRVICRIDGFLPALFGCPECEQERDIAQGSAQILQDILHFRKVKSTLKPVYAPLDQIQMYVPERSRCRQNLFFCHSNDWNNDLRNAFSDLYTAHFDNVCHSLSPGLFQSFIYIFTQQSLNNNLNYSLDKLNHYLVFQDNKKASQKEFGGLCGV